MIVDTYFPTSIGRESYKDHQNEKDDLVNYCYEIQKNRESGGSGWLSNETYNTSDGKFDVVDDIKFRKINNFVSKSVANYLVRTGLKMKLYMSDAWFNIYKKNNYQEFHQHSGCIVSCIYFLKIPTPEKVYFKSPYKEMLFSSKYTGDYNPSDWVHYVPDESNLLVFRSYVEHAVELHKSDEDRITIAYNFKEII